MKFAINSLYPLTSALIVQPTAFMLKSITNNDSKINAKTWSQTHSIVRRRNNSYWRSIWKDSTRKILNQNDIKKNILSIKKVFNKILENSNKKTKPIFVDNADWLTKLNLIEFLRDIGSHFTVNKMLTFDEYQIKIREGAVSKLYGI